MKVSVRLLAVAVLLLGVVGSANLAERRDRDQREPADIAGEATDHGVELDALRGRAEANERTDRSQRGALRESLRRAQEDAEAAEQGASRADEQETRPAEPEPADGGSADSGSSGGGSTGPVPASCDEYGGNRATGCTLLLDAGFSIDQMSCLENLWDKESGWNHRAQNPSSGAYGIPQALPGSKMAEYGDDWRTNPVTQIRWGLDYIEDRYGTPCSAWQFSQRNGWY